MLRALPCKGRHHGRRGRWWLILAAGWSWWAGPGGSDDRAMLNGGLSWLEVECNR
jgi:hypothetical protein